MKQALLLATVAWVALALPARAEEAVAAPFMPVLRMPLDLSSHPEAYDDEEIIVTGHRVPPRETEAHAYSATTDPSMGPRTTVYRYTALDLGALRLGTNVTATEPSSEARRGPNDDHAHPRGEVVFPFPLFGPHPDD